VKASTRRPPRNEHGEAAKQIGGDENYYWTSFGPTNAGSYTARLVPGTYDLYFSHAETAGDATPMNTLVRLRCFTVP